jgi:hypothetical protein
MESYVAYLIKDSDVPMVRDSVMVLNPTLIMNKFNFDFRHVLLQLTLS